MTQYLAILKGKDAEYGAWGTASAAVRAATRVIYEMVPNANLKPPNNEVTNFVNRASRQWPTGAMMTVDSGHINRPGVALRVATLLRQGQIESIPVAHIGDRPTVLADVAAAAALQGNGACLRVGSVGQVPDPVQAGAGLPGLLGILGLAPNQIDLVIDFAVVSSALAVTGAVQVALAMLTWAVSEGPWRSVAIAAGAFPDAISDANRFPLGQTAPVHRYDAVFFAGVSAGNPAVEPDYGDYGINHPAMPGPAWRGPKPNLRYTVGLDWRVYRDDNVLPGNESFFTLCGRVVQAPHWAGAAYSAGDQEIERCSRGVGSPGRATEWLSYGTSHHMAHVVDRLANLGVP